MEGHTTILLFINVFISFFFALHFYGHEVLASDSDIKILIDHDGGADDAMAIFIALLREKYFNGSKLIGLSTIYGTVNETQTFNNSKAILNVINRLDVPIYRGVSSPLISSLPSQKLHIFGIDGLGSYKYPKIHINPAKDDSASVAVVHLAKKYPGKLTVIALGPLTNIAIAIKLYPGLIKKLNKLIIAYGQDNFSMDPESLYIVAKYSIPNKVTYFPYSAIDKLNITKKWRETVLGAIKTNVMQTQNDFESVYLSSNHSLQWSLLSPAVSSLFQNPKIAKELEFTAVTDTLCGSERGQANYILKKNESEANSEVVSAVDAELYKSFLVQTFSAQLPKTNN